MPSPDRVEKFSASELTQLRQELMQSGLDSWQAAEMVTSFLAAHGYGVKSDLVSDVLIRLEGAGCSSVDCMQMQLERVALVM